MKMNNPQMKKTIANNILALLNKADRLGANTPMARWERLVWRNSYTIEPTRPAPVHADIAAGRARAKAQRLWQELGNWTDGYAPILSRQAVQRLGGY